MGTTPEKRRHERYDTELKVYFDFAYDIATKVKYQIIEKGQEKTVSRKYSGLSRNVSAEGLSFISKRQLEEGTFLNLEVYLPSATEPVHMQGEVRWSRVLKEEEAEEAYQTGVRLRTVNGQEVEATIHYDPEYHVNWSIVLESILGNFKDLAKKRHPG